MDLITDRISILNTGSHFEDFEPNRSVNFMGKPVIKNRTAYKVQTATKLQNPKDQANKKGSFSHKSLPNLLSRHSFDLFIIPAQLTEIVTINQFKSSLIYITISQFEPNPSIKFHGEHL